jgi:hypothetical protein
MLFLAIINHTVVGLCAGALMLLKARAQATPSFLANWAEANLRLKPVSGKQCNA